MYKQAKDLQKKQELEDAKNQASDMAVGKVLNSATEFQKIIDDIANAENKQRKDNFT